MYMPVDRPVGRIESFLLMDLVFRNGLVFVMGVIASLSPVDIVSNGRCFPCESTRSALAIPADVFRKI